MTADLKDFYTRLAKVPVAVLSDVLRAAGVPHHALHYDIRRLYKTPTLVGPAYCVSGRLSIGGVPKRKGPEPRIEMFRRISSGDVLVIAANGYEDGAVLGENMVVALQEGGCAGIVTDGGTRDVDNIGTLGIPVYAKFGTPLSTKQWAIDEIEAPVVLKGQASATVTIRPGDIIAADGDGVVVLPKEGAQTIAEDAVVYIEQEEKHRQLILQGRDPGEVYKTVNRYAHVRPVN